MNTIDSRGRKAARMINDLRRERELPGGLPAAAIKIVRQESESHLGVENDVVAVDPSFQLVYGPATMLKRTPFHDFHASAGAKLVDFAGWEMPLLYRGIVDEHDQTRKSGSLFDVSHMGRLYISGADAVPFLDQVLTRNVAEIRVGQSRYSLVCNPSGGVMDDVIISKDAKNWILICNASNREKIVNHLKQHTHGKAVEIDDKTESTAMVAIQGPKVIDRMAELLPVDVKGMKRYSFESSSFMLIKFTVFRSGYTGEDGVELILPAKMASMAMKLVGNKDHEGSTIRPAGLGARDTLRIEAGMPLYGHELSETIDPLSAGLGWAVDLKKDFIGSGPLKEIEAAGGPKRKLVGLFVDGKRIARQGTPVVANGAVIGEVSSGTFSPTLQKSIAMAFVDSSSSAEGTSVAVDLKGTHNPATVTKLPFYKRAAKQPGLPGI